MPRRSGTVKMCLSDRDVPFHSFIPSAVASDIANFGARLTRANGEVFQDTKQGVWLRIRKTSPALVR